MTLALGPLPSGGGPRRGYSETSVGERLVLHSLALTCSALVPNLAVSEGDSAWV